MCIIMRWPRNRSASWAERFWTSSLLCTYKLCDCYSPIPILSPFLFTPIPICAHSQSARFFIYLYIMFWCLQFYFPRLIVQSATIFMCLQKLFDTHCPLNNTESCYHVNCFTGYRVHYIFMIQIIIVQTIINEIDSMTQCFLHFFGSLIEIMTGSYT